MVIMIMKMVVVVGGDDDGDMGKDRQGKRVC